MNLTINGQSRHIPNVDHLQAAILSFLPDGGSRVIAELNGHIIAKDHWVSTPLKDGDHLELVSFVGGG